MSQSSHSLVRRELHLFARKVAEEKYPRFVESEVEKILAQAREAASRGELTMFYESEGYLGISGDLFKDLVTLVTSRLRDKPIALDVSKARVSSIFTRAGEEYLFSCEIDWSSTN